MQIGLLRIDFGKDEARLPTELALDALHLLLAIGCVCECTATVLLLSRKPSEGTREVRWDGHDDRSMSFVLYGPYGEYELTVKLPKGKSGVFYGGYIDDIRGDSWKRLGEAKARAFINAAVVGVAYQKTLTKARKSNHQTTVQKPVTITRLPTIPRSVGIVPAVKQAETCEGTQAATEIPLSEVPPPVLPVQTCELTPLEAPRADQAAVLAVEPQSVKTMTPVEDSVAPSEPAHVTQTLSPSHAIPAGPVDENELSRARAASELLGSGNILSFRRWFGDISYFTLIEPAVRVLFMMAGHRYRRHKFGVESREEVSSESIERVSVGAHDKNSIFVSFVIDSQQTSLGAYRYIVKIWFQTPSLFEKFIVNIKAAASRINQRHARMK